MNETAYESQRSGLALRRGGEGNSTFCYFERQVQLQLEH